MVIVLSPKLQGSFELAKQDWNTVNIRYFELSRTKKFVRVDEYSNYRTEFVSILSSRD